MEEIRHDPDVIALSGGGPLSKTEHIKLGLEKLEELTIERFRKLMEFLTTRYSQSGTHSAGGILTIPDTMAEFRAAYTLSFAQATLRQRRPLQEVKNVVDIHCSVVYNVIHSSLCTVEDKASWAFQLFKIYQQYPDILLRSTLAKMKSDMMIAQKKRSLAKYVALIFQKVKLLIIWLETGNRTLSFRSAPALTSCPSPTSTCSCHVTSLRCSTARTAISRTSSATSCSTKIKVATCSGKFI